MKRLIFLAFLLVVNLACIEAKGYNKTATHKKRGKGDNGCLITLTMTITYLWHLQFFQFLILCLSKTPDVFLP